MDLAEGLLKRRLVTNRNRTMLGFISPGRGEIYSIMLGLRNIGGEISIFSTAIQINCMQDVEGPEDFLTIRKNFLDSIERTKNELIKQEDILKTSEVDLENIFKIKVKKSNKTIIEILNETKEYEEKLKYDREFIIIEGNKVRIPKYCCPYFYNTWDDLNKFEIGDVVKVKFGEGYRTANKFKNKLLTFVVNNFMSHNWCRPTRRLALIPLTEGWTLKDVVILDDSDRFEALMVDLFPCNRIPYKGWKTKEVTIKKLGEQIDIPKTGHKPRPSLAQLWDQQKDEYVFLGEYSGSEIYKVGKFKDIQSSPTYKIYTTKDKEAAIKWLKGFIEKTKKEIEELKESIKNCSEFVAGIKFIEDLNYFERRIKG